MGNVQEVITIRQTTLSLGLIGGFSSLILWVVFVFYNPYSNIPLSGSMIITFLMLCMPACLAIVAVIFSKPAFMLVAFIWALPYSLYLFFTPGIFKLFGASCLLYLISYFLMKLPTHFNSNRTNASF